MSYMKYKSPKQVMLALLQGVKRKSLQDIKYRNKGKNLDYVNLIQDGIDMYDNYKINEELNRLTDNV